MNYLVKYSPEITIKSRPVRTRFAKQLRTNLAKLLLRLSEEIQIKGNWDYVGVEVPATLNHLQPQVEQVLASTQGICFYERVQVFKVNTLDEILLHTLPIFQNRLIGKTFAVRCRRIGKHDFTSMDVEKFVGSGLNTNIKTAGVSLSNPEALVKLEIRKDKLFVVEENFPGLSGFPLGTLDGVLSLISGGFDSSVSSYMSMKRGLKTHFCFFNLGGREHEIAVKEVALYLWMRFGSTHTVSFITVPFEEVVAEILKKVDNSQMGVVLKRMMLRAATQVAQRMKLEAMVTGESVAQVSSQTLANLAIIDKVTDILILRPLAMMEKQEIVDIARVIGTEEFSAVIPEYCGVISNKPTTRARMPRLKAQEDRFDFSVLDKAVAGSVKERIDKIQLDTRNDNNELRIVQALSAGEVVLDIRHPDEEERDPLKLEDNSVEKVPFYKLNSVFPGLPPEISYSLYCGKGIMSKLHASYLMDQGFANVGVYLPE